MGQKRDDFGFEKRLRALGYAVMRIEREGGPQRDGTIEVTDVRFVLNADHGSSVLAVVKGREGEERVIAFVGGYDLSTVILDLGRRVQKGTLRWRADVPYSERQEA